jgi:hypothetical protein
MLPEIAQGCIRAAPDPAPTHALVRRHSGTLTWVSG